MLSTVVEKYLDYREDMKAYKRFRVFSTIEDEIDIVTNNFRKFISAFSVKEYKKLNV